MKLLKTVQVAQVATKIFQNRQKIANRQAKILALKGSQNRQLSDKSPFLVTLPAREQVRRGIM